MDFSEIERDHIDFMYQRKRKNNVEDEFPNNENFFDFSREEQAHIAAVNTKMKLLQNNGSDSVHDRIHKTLEIKHRAFDEHQFVPDSRDELRKELQEKFPVDEKIDYSLKDYSVELKKPVRSTEQTKSQRRKRRNIEDHRKLFKFYRAAVSTTTEWQEWRNISGTMKRFPRFSAVMITRNRHFKVFQEMKRKMKKEEIIKRYDEKSEKLRKKYHRGEKITRGEVKKVKGKRPKNKRVDEEDPMFNEFFKTTQVTVKNNINNYKMVHLKNTLNTLYDGMEGSASELFYKDEHTPLSPITMFDSDKTVESNYINETLVKKLGLKLNVRERKELNKNLKKFEVFEQETLAPHFYEDDREDIFKHEEEIFGQRATPLDPLDGLQLLPYVLREKTLPPGPPQDNTVEEVIRNCKHLDIDNFRKLGEQKLPRYVLKVHDRRRRFKNNTKKTTIKDYSVISAGDEEEFMKRITIKTVPGRLLYDHEKLYDKIMRNKFKYKRVIYNDSLCWAYRELTKLAPVYITIVPKKNLTSLGDAEEEDAFLLGHMFYLCQKLAFDLKMRDGYRVVINNGHTGNHNITHLNIMLIGGRQMRYPKYYDLSHWTSDRSEVDHDISTYGDNFHLSGRMADFFGSYGSLKEKRAKWLSSKYPKMCQKSEELF